MYSKKFIPILSLFLLGFVLQSSYAQEKTRLEELFKMSLEELMNLTITTAGKQEEKISDVPASVVVVTRADIETYGYQSVEEILENVPGMYMIDDYLWIGQKNFGVRGFFSAGQFDNMIVLINGVNQKNEGLSDSYSSEKIAVPVEAIDRIEIIRGPMSVIYGSGAFFGAINIITNDFSNNEDVNVVSSSLGNQNMSRLFARFGGKIKDFQYSFNASFYNDDGIDEPFNKMMSDVSLLNLPYTEGGWGLESDRIGGLLKTKRRYVNLNGKYKNLTFDLGLVHSRKNSIETIPSTGNGSWVYFFSGHASLFYKKQFSNAFSLEGNFGYFGDHHWVDHQFFLEDAYTNNWVRMNGYEAELLSTITPNPDLSFTMGLYRRTVEGLSITADYPTFGLPDSEVIYKDNITNHAFFTQVKFDPFQRLKLVAGVRLERLEPYEFVLNANFLDPENLGMPQPPLLSVPYKFESVNKFEFIPRFAAIYSLTKNHILKLLYGKAIKQPNVVANIDVALNGSPALKPAIIETIELNYLASISEKFITNISIFQNNLDNLISRLNVLGDEGAIMISSNAGKMSTFGVEANIQWMPFSTTKFDLSMTYQDSKNDRAGFKDIDLGYAPKVLGYGKVVVDISKNAIFAITGRYIDKMYAGWNMANIDENNEPFIPEGDPLEGRLGYEIDSCFTLDTNIRIKNLFNSGLYLNARISNLLDKDVFYPTTTSNPLFDKGTMGRGRTFLITLGWMK